MTTNARMTEPDADDDAASRRIEALNLVLDDTVAVIVIHRVGAGHTALPPGAQASDAEEDAHAAAEVLITARSFGEVHDMTIALDHLLGYLRQRLAVEAIGDLRDMLNGALEGLAEDEEGRTDG